jgi:hypothetical protein
MRIRAESLAISWGAGFISSRSSPARLGLGIEVGDAGNLDELLLRLFEARDGIAVLLPASAPGPIPSVPDPDVACAPAAAWICLKLRN